MPTHVVEIEGQVDLYSAPEFKERTTRALDVGATRVIIDLSRVTFMDSTGLGILINTLNRVRLARGELALVVTNYDLERLLDLTGLHGTFTLYRSRDQAVRELEAL